MVDFADNQDKEKTRMKKLYFTFIIFIFCGISIFGDNDTREEVDFLLFMPNSSNQFVNEEQAFIQLDNLAQYLSNKSLIPGQIIVYGYAAFAPNKIESFGLSRERAIFVINELQKRGVSKDLFSDPTGYGSVNLWGNNANENDKKPNRRVRILLDGESPVPVTQEIVNAETKTVIPDTIGEDAAAPEDTAKESGFKFPWWLLFLLALLLLLLFLLIKKRSGKPAHKKGDAQPQIIKTDAVSKPASGTATYTVNLDEEIRLRAYELFKERNGEGDYQDQDWYNALREISEWYTARGYSVSNDDGSWWASKAYSQ